MGSPNPGKAGSDTAAEHRFVNQKIQNIKKRRLPMRNLNQKIQNLKKNADYQLGIWTKNPHFWKLKLDFFPIKKVFRLTANMKKITYY